MGDGEHLAADEALAVAQVEDLGEELGNVVAQTGDEGGEGGEVRGAVATEGDEGYMFAAGAFDAATADDALAVGEQHDLEQHPRRVGRSTRLVVAVAGIEAGEIDLMVDQVVQRVLERARDELSFEIDGNEARAGVYVFVAGHRRTPKTECLLEP